MSKLFEEMVQGTAEALAYMEGARSGYKVHAPVSVDVRAIREKVHLSQTAFADSFGLSVDAVRNWESGRRSPDASARILLSVISHAPETVREALRSTPQQMEAKPKSGPVVRPGRPRKGSLSTQAEARPRRVKQAVVEAR